VSPFYTGIMITFAVYEETEEGNRHVGTGYYFQYGNRHGSPEVFDFNGIPLAAKWYRLIALETKAVVMVDTIQ